MEGRGDFWERRCGGEVRKKQSERVRCPIPTRTVWTSRSKGKDRGPEGSSSSPGPGPRTRPRECLRRLYFFSFRPAQLSCIWYWADYNSC